jgi:hypothetical protein
LNRVGQFQPQGRSQPCRVFGDADVERDRPPGLQNSERTLRKPVIAGAERSGQDFRNRDCRDGEAQSARGVRFEQRSESRRELRMILENVNDRRGIDKKERSLRQIAEG